jgi:hypothetical protein
VEISLSGTKISEGKKNNLKEKIGFSRQQPGLVVSEVKKRKR